MKSQKIESISNYTRRADGEEMLLFGPRSAENVFTLIYTALEETCGSYGNVNDGISGGKLKSISIRRSTNDVRASSRFSFGFNYVPYVEHRPRCL